MANKNIIRGNLIVSGTIGDNVVHQMSGTYLSLSASSTFGRGREHFHQMSGSHSISGNLYVEGTHILKIGQGPSGTPYNISTTTIGVDDTTTYGLAPLYIYSNKVNNGYTQYTTPTGSIILSAHPFAAIISASHPIVEIGWRDNSNLYRPSWYITETDISSSERSSAQMLGNEVDAAAAIGTIIGSAEYYSTAGSKLLTVINGTGSMEREREYTDYIGNKIINQSDYTGSTQFKYWSELVTITGTYIDTVNTIEAGAICYGVGCYVVTDIPTASYFHIGHTGPTEAFYQWGYGVVPSASVNNLTTSMSGSMQFYTASTAVRITPNTGIGTGFSYSDTGTVRVEARYMVIIPPQS